MLFNVMYTPDLDGSEDRNQSLINKSKQAGNKNQVDYDYEVNEEFLIYRDGIYHKLEVPYIVQYNVVQI